ncbi:MAG: hypothetical protein IKI58_00300 [Oscillospiraceae bacterium]|nr:hypothetical protein [Oscillospiraceae bacterium]
MKAKRVSGEVFPVYLSAHHVNAMLAAFDEIIEADPENTVSRTADKLKTKVLQHGRTFYDCGEHSVSIYLFPSEIIPLIKILLMMLTFRQPVRTDYYPLIGKVKKQRQSPENDFSFSAGQLPEH